MVSGDELNDLIRAAWRVIESDFDETEVDAWRRKASEIMAGWATSDDQTSSYQLERHLPPATRNSHDIPEA